MQHVRRVEGKPVQHVGYVMAQHPVQGLGLVFVAVYQRALKLLYVDVLLERIKAEFAEQVAVMLYPPL